MILLPLTPTTPVLRKKAAYEGISPEKVLSLVRELTARQQYLDALDLAEQLYREHPQEAVRILAWTYDSIYRILREKKSRYWLYQARYFDFQIQPEDKVLDIGSGHMPFPFATHLADYAIEDSRYGRAGEPFEHVAGKPVIQCSIEKMPFADREFDFVYCSHVLEHTENPETACRELMRVAKRGYIEMPTKGKDVFFDTARVSRHRWSADILNRCLVLTEYCPEELKGLECDVLGRMVYAPKTEEEKAFYALQFLKADVLNVMLYWEESFAYEVRRISEPTVKPASPLPLVSASGEISPPASGAAPRFSFVMIVLNGMPFIQYSLKSIYDFAHEIIIVEGAVEKCMFAANPDGSSKDGTVEFLRQFPDPARKIRLIQGRWPEKCEMQNEALRYVTGDYVWLIDSDEVYKREHLEKIKEILQRDPSITQVNFIFDNFWKGLNYLFVSEKFFEPACHCRRVFRYKPGAVFTSHRPPTLQWPGSTQTTEQMRLLDGHTTRRMGIIPSHYSYVTREQVHQKIELYRRYGWGQMWNLNLEDWYEQCFLKWTSANRLEIESRWPVWTGDPNSHTEPFTGTHPEVMIEYLIQRTTIRENGQETILMKHVVEAAREIKNFFKERPLQALETGTIRTFDEEMHFSTYFLAKELEGHGNLTTVDTSPLSIKRSQNICYEFKNITYVLSDSRVYLSGLKNQKLHLVFLDSANDAEIIFQEFACVVPLMAEGGILLIDDAGILPDGTGKDRNTAAQKGHRVWEFLRACGAEFTVLPAPGGRGTQLKLVMHCQNSRKIKSYLNEMCKSETENQTKNSNCSEKRLKVAEEHVKSGMMIQEGSAFAEAIGQVIREYRPKKILETGTYLGQGTTAVIAEAMKQNGIDGTFFTIEVNPRYHAQAKAYLESRGYPVQSLCGLSIPRRLLPSREQIQQTTTTVQDESLFVDHPEPVRAQRYYQETDFPDVPDDLLGKCLAIFDGRPDLVLLDSAGHLGWIEFQYVFERLKGPCILALDDIDHIKHHRSFQYMQKDGRFEILVSSNEKFGFCIARFDPQRRSRPQPHPLEPKHILWLRPDAIGDGILSSEMLPRIRRRFPSARLTVFVQQTVAPLYEACPFVDEILCFQPEETNDPVQFLRRWSQRIWTLKADCLLHSVYSRQFLMDGLAYASGIPERIGMEGDCCNIHPEKKAKSDGWYTRLIPSDGDWKPELERHRDFLRGLGCDDQPLKPVIWLTAEDEAYAHKWLEENQINPEQLVVFFAGARVSLRHYEGYGKALEATAVKHRLTVAALGAKEDFEINQRNLDWLKERGIRTFNLCGRLSLRQSAAILKQCRLAVGAETGLAHMAAAVEVPHVVVIGGGHFGRFMPYSPKTTLAALPLDCYGCNWLCRYEQERNYCIQDLQPAVLSEAVRETFEKSSSRPRVFIQNEPLYEKPESGPSWKLFSKFIDTGAVEIRRVSPPQQDFQTHAPSLPAAPAVLRSKEHRPAAAFPKITIVTPSYNQAPYLEECIQSVLSQNYPNLEYIIMDGGSTDGSVEIIKKYEKYLTYWQSKPDGGQYAAVEEGFRRSTGEILTWINSDDMLLPGALRKAAAIFLNRPDVQWITGKVCTLEADGTIHWAALAPVFWNRAKYLAKDYKYIQQEGSFWRRQLWEKAGAFLWKESRLAGDLELWNRFFRHADLYTAEAFLGAFRMQPNRKTASLLEKYNQEAEAVLEAELQQYASQPAHSRPPLRKSPPPITELEISRYLEVFPDQQPSQPVQIPSSGNFLVSAIVSTYNAEAFIRGCLQDLVEQTLYQKGLLEIIVVDSGSQQNEGRIVRQFQACYPNIRYLRTPQRETIYAAWNRAIRMASGKYLTSANTDDRHRPDALEILAETLEKNPKIALVYSDQVIAPIPLERFSARWGQLIPRPDYSYERLLFGCCVGSQPMWRKSLHEEFGLFDETLTVAGDWDFWLRIAARYPFQRVPEFLGVYYNNPASAEHGRPIHSLYERYLVGKRYGNPHISIIPPCVRKDNPLVSVILPVYNGADYIAEAIESVLIQNYPYWELLIINDGSEDNTEEIVKRFSDERIQYFLQNHGGPSAARNEGIRRSKGQFLVMLDHDDYLTADHIGQMLTAYDRYPEADLIYCDTLLLNEEGKALRVHQRQEFQNPNYLIREIFQAGFPIIPFRTCIRRRVFEKIGEYDPSLWVAEDYDMWRRFLKQGLIFRHWPKSYYCRRIRRNAHSRIITPEKARMHFEVLQRYLETFEPEQLFPDADWKKWKGPQQEFVFHYLAGEAFAKLAEQYKQSALSPILIQMACQAALEQADFCESIYPQQPFVIQLCRQCEQMLAGVGTETILQEAVAE